MADAACIAAAYCRYLRVVESCGVGVHASVATLSEWCTSGVVDRCFGVSGGGAELDVGRLLVHGRGLDVGSGEWFEEVASRACERSGVVASGRLVGRDGPSTGGTLADGLDGSSSGAGHVPVAPVADASAARVEAGVLLGPNGGLSVGRGSNYERNQRVRERRRAASSCKGNAGVPEWRRRASGNGSSAARLGLQESLEAKWVAENALAKLKAERQVELLRAQDLEEIKRMQRAQVLRTTETCKVQTEKAFASLARSGNVPGCQVVDGGGRVEGTVLTNSTPGLVRSAGDTISPDSSASMHEFRKCQKDLLDAEAANAKLMAEGLRMSRVIERLRGLYPAEDPGVFDYSEPAKAVTHYTLDSDGDLPANAPDCFGYDNGKGQWRLSEPDCDFGDDRLF